MTMTQRQLENDEHDAAIVPAARGFVMAGGFTGVLLVHGFAGSIADLQPLAESLHTEGYSVIGVRLPGHGSTVNSLHASQADDWRGAVQRGLASFPPTVTKIVIVGESMGALLAVSAANLDDRIVGLVLLAPAFHVTSEFGRMILSWILPRRYRMKKPWLSDNDRAEREAKGSLTELTVGSYRHFLRVVRRARADVRSVHVPVLAFFSEHDEETSLQSVNFLGQLPAEKVKIVKIDGDSHHLVTGRDAGEVIVGITRFISSLV